MMKRLVTIGMVSLMWGCWEQKNLSETSENDTDDDVDTAVDIEADEATDSEAVVEKRDVADEEESEAVGAETETDLVDTGRAAGAETETDLLHTGRADEPPLQTDWDTEFWKLLDNCYNDDGSEVQAWMDMDGDGYRSRAASKSFCSEDELPTYAILMDDVLGEDCDDADPSRFQKACVDADQDGHCAQTVLCVGDPIPDGFSPFTYRGNGIVDCDDENPNLQTPLFADEDGDLEASTMWSVCVSEGEESEYSELYTPEPGFDCDDHDAKRVPYQIDLQGDGLDLNCDGEDDLNDCVADNENYPEVTLETVCESGVDLAVLEGRTSTGCGEGTEYGYVLVANLGTERFDGRVLVESVFDTQYFGDNEKIPDGSVKAEFSLVLEPLEQRYIQVSFCTGVFSIHPQDIEDCDPRNNEAPLEINIILCI